MFGSSARADNHGISGRIITNKKRFMLRQRPIRRSYRGSTGGLIDLGTLDVGDLVHLLAFLAAGMGGGLHNDAAMIARAMVRIPVLRLGPGSYRGIECCQGGSIGGSPILRIELAPDDVAGGAPGRHAKTGAGQCRPRIAVTKSKTSTKTRQQSRRTARHGILLLFGPIPSQPVSGISRPITTTHFVTRFIAVPMALVPGTWKRARSLDLTMSLDGASLICLENHNGGKHCERPSVQYRNIATKPRFVN